MSLQVSLGRVGFASDVPGDYQSLSDFWIDTFLDVLGPSGTLLVPTYTYSIGKGEIFEVEKTPSVIGQFTEIFRKRPGVIRSRDPMLSTAGYGAQARDILRTISHSCYGDGSTFAKLHELNAKISTLGVSLYWATFRHYIEEQAQVPFRFNKSFTGVVREDGESTTETWTYFAAYRDARCEPNGLPLEQRVREAGLLRIVPIGRGELMTISAADYFRFGIDQLRKDPWLTAKGPPTTEALLPD